MHKRMSLLLLAGLVLLPGCMRVSTYKRMPLKSIRGNFTYRASQKNLVMQAKLLNNADRYALFTERVQNLYGYDVIYLAVHNLSDLAYVLSADDVDLVQANPREIAKLMKKSSVGKVLGGNLAGFYTAGIISAFIHASATAGGVGDMGFVFIPLGTIFSIITLVMGIQGIKSMVMNHRVGVDLAEKMLNKSVNIQSGEKYESLIFIKASFYHPQFSITLHEKENNNNKVIFDIDCSSLGICVHNRYVGGSDEYS